MQRKFKYILFGGLLGFLIGAFPIVFDLLNIVNDEIEEMILNKAILIIMPAFWISELFFSVMREKTAVFVIVSYGLFLAPFFYAAIGALSGYIISRRKL